MLGFEGKIVKLDKESKNPCWPYQQNIRNYNSWPFLGLILCQKLTKGLQDGSSAGGCHQQAWWLDFNPWNSILKER